METLTIANIALMLGALFVLIGIASSLIASRFGAPLLLVFLGARHAGRTGWDRRDRLR